MAKTTKPAPRGRRPKAEVQREFETIKEAVAEARESADEKVAEVERQREEEVRRAVEGISVEGVVQKISTLGLEINKALAQVSAKLVEQVEQLSDVREAVTIERRELERLHKLDTAATALDQLVHSHAQEKQRLEAEIAAQRAAWEEETRIWERARQEQEDALKKQRQREIEDYEYKKAQERKKAQDKYEEEMRLLEKRNSEKQETLEKSWKQREAELKAKEQEFDRLKKESEEFPARMAKENQQAALQATRLTEARYEQQLALLKKDSEADKRVAELRVKTLEETVARQAAQIEALQRQLDEAKRQVQEIAVRAIEGASGARALSHVEQIAMEQAKSRGTQS